jgi:HPt (histidine-containing phosphotransfer) domain-containing protein
VGSKDRCLEAGMNDYVSKPVRLADVEAVLERYFASRPASAGEVREPKAAPSAQPEPAPTFSKPAPASSEPIVDEEMIDELRTMEIPGESDTLLALINIFKRNGEAELDRLQKAIAAGQIREVNRVAHKLKGSCGNFGARKMFSICHRLETEAANQHIENAVQLCQEIRTAFDELNAALHRIHSGTKN